jgi:hypothetical protein
MTRTKPPQVKKEKTKTGPKPKFQTEDGIIDLIYRLGLLGLGNREIAQALDIHLKTFEYWLKTYKEVWEVVRAARVESSGRVANALFKKAIGYSHPDTQVFLYRGEPIIVPTIKHYPPDTGAACFWLKNKTRDLENPWTDVTKHELTGKDGGSIQLNVLNNLEDHIKNLSDEQMELLKTMVPITHQVGKEEETE